MALFERRCLRAGALALCVAASSVSASALEESKSAAVAKELVQTLDAAKLDGIAAPDPSSPGAFIAALYIPGTQLLVVGAQYAAPPLLVDRITAKDYRGVYVDLQSASVRGSKVFVMDQGADGLNAHADNNQPADSWEEKDTTVAFDGDWKKAKVAEADYMKSFASADERYARMLGTLLAQVKGQKKAGS
jgi:hypothetical protein